MTTTLAATKGATRMAPMGMDQADLEEGDQEEGGGEEMRYEKIIFIVLALLWGELPIL